MAAKFTAGDSVKTTRTLTAKDPPSNEGLHKNTMKGLPGYINAHDPKSSAHMKGGKDMLTPKANSGLSAKEREIGKRGGENGRKINSTKMARGTVTNSYLQDSTRGSPGAIMGNKMTGAKHVHTGKAPGRGSGHMPNMGSTANGKLYDAMRGGKTSPHAAQPKGRSGMMESLRGRAKTSAERSAKRSSMY